MYSLDNVPLPRSWCLHCFQLRPIKHSNSSLKPDREAFGCLLLSYRVPERPSIALPPLLSHFARVKSPNREINFNCFTAFILNTWKYFDDKMLRVERLEFRCWLLPSPCESVSSYNVEFGPLPVYRTYCRYSRALLPIVSISLISEKVTWTDLNNGQEEKDKGQ